MSHSEKVYAVILNTNNWPHVVECLESLLRSNYDEYQVIVCDNGSTDGSIDHIKKWAEGSEKAPATTIKELLHLTTPPVNKPIPYAELSKSEAESGHTKYTEKLLIIANGANLGFTGGNNVGLRYALKQNDFTYIWILNDDTVVAPDAIKYLQVKMSKDKSIGICGATVLYYYAPELIQAMGGAHYHKWTGRGWLIGHGKKFTEAKEMLTNMKKMSYVFGASMFVRKEFIDKIGLLSESYFLYFDEIDWATRAAGHYELGYEPTAIVYHKHGATIGSASTVIGKKRSAFSAYWFARSSIIFTHKYYPKALFTVYLYSLARCIKFMILVDRRVALSYLKGLLSPFVKHITPPSQSSL